MLIFIVRDAFDDMLYYGDSYWINYWNMNYGITPLQLENILYHNPSKSQVQYLPLVVKLPIQHAEDTRLGVKQREVLNGHDEVQLKQLMEMSHLFNDGNKVMRNQINSGGLQKKEEKLTYGTNTELALGLINSRLSLLKPIGSILSFPEVASSNNLNALLCKSPLLTSSISLMSLGKGDLHNNAVRLLELANSGNDNLLPMGLSNLALADDPIVNLDLGKESTYSSSPMNIPQKPVCFEKSIPITSVPQRRVSSHCLLKTPSMSSYNDPVQKSQGILNTNNWLRRYAIESKVAACRFNSLVALSFNCTLISNMWTLVALSFESILDEKYSVDANIIPLWWYDSAIGGKIMQLLLKFCSKIGDIQTYGSILSILLDQSIESAYLDCKTATTVLLHLHHQNVCHLIYPSNIADGVLCAYADLLLRWGLQLASCTMYKHITCSSYLYFYEQLPHVSVISKNAISSSSLVELSRGSVVDQQRARGLSMDASNKRKSAMAVTCNCEICGIERGLSGCSKCMDKLATCNTLPPRCCICFEAVKGIVSFCAECGHGGHIEHMYAWFSSHVECPSGCDCECKLKLEKRRKSHSASGDSSKGVHDTEDEEIDEALELLKGGFSHDSETSSNFSSNEDSD